MVTTETVRRANERIMSGERLGGYMTEEEARLYMKEAVTKRGQSAVSRFATWKREKSWRYITLLVLGALAGFLANGTVIGAMGGLVVVWFLDLQIEQQFGIQSATWREGKTVMVYTLANAFQTPPGQPVMIEFRTDKLYWGESAVDELRWCRPAGGAWIATPKTRGM